MPKCIENYMNIIYLFLPFDLSLPEQISWKRLGLDHIPLIIDSSRSIFNQTIWSFLHKHLMAERRLLFLHEVSSYMFGMILYKPLANAFKKSLQHFLRKCKLALILSCIMLKLRCKHIKIFKVCLAIFQHNP